MNKLQGFKGFCRNSGLTYEEGIIKLQKLVPPALLNFSGEDIVVDYNVLGICWQVYKTTLETIGLPDNREALYSMGVDSINKENVLSTAVHNSEIECRLVSLYAELAKENKTLQFMAKVQDPIRTYYVLDEHGNVDLCYHMYKYLEQPIVMFN